MSDFKYRLIIIILTDYAHPSETTGLNLFVAVSIVRDLVPFFYISPCQRQRELFPSHGIHRLLSVVSRLLHFHIK